ncbi:PepSY-associated TM helix domain-containing protein [Thiorhodococcus fuscus]|uniref:PepSY-associated TM helix domain-containing protein n=1 Tax=Thiorhodococcus fuscus TaxID=527200 RepID=A0ABW4Y6J1_9GAMM
MSRIVPAEILRIYKIVHSWVGILAGLALFIAFYAGALTVFKEPLSHWTAAGQPIPTTAFDQAETLIARTLAERADARHTFTLHLGRTSDPSVYLSWHQDQDARSQWTATLDGEGALSVTERGAKDIGDLVDHIHRTAGLPGGLEFGSLVMGIVSALYVIALVSGFIVWLPSARKDLLALRLERNPKRAWLDGHNVVGIASLPFHLAIALTAVVFGLHDSIYASLDRTVYGGQVRPILQAANPYTVVAPDARPADMLPPADLLARVRAFAPGFEPTAIQYRNPGTEGAMAVILGEDPRHLVRAHGFLVSSPVSGAILNTDYLPGRQGTWGAIVAAFFALHFGTFGGEPVRWSYFLLALAGAFLFYSGNWLWIESRRRAHARDGASGPTRSLRAMEALTTGGILGCIGGLSVAIALGKLLHGHVTHPQPWLWTAYYLCFLGAIAWAWRRGAEQAARPLLLLCAVATLAIPWASWQASDLELGQSLLARHGGAMPGVDWIALCGAFALLWLAWRHFKQSARPDPMATSQNAPPHSG